jgi:type III secretory pathway component EscV
MKKILTFAILALLLGGLTVNANAQKRTKSNAKETAVAKKVGKEVDWEKTLKEYEGAVDQCVSIYKKMQKAQKEVKDENGYKNLVKQFNDSLAKAEGLKAQLEKVRSELTRSQVNRFNKANKKLAKVYIK